MSYKISLSAGVKDLGIAPYSQCANCHSQNALHITQTYLIPKVFALPTLKLRSVLLATCPHCHQIMQVSPVKAKALQHDISTVIFTKDLVCVKKKHLVDINFTKKFTKFSK